MIFRISTLLLLSSVALALDPWCCDDDGNCTFPYTDDGGGPEQECINSGFTFGDYNCPKGCKSRKSTKSPTTKVPSPPKIGKKTKAPKLSEETKSP